MNPTYWPLPVYVARFGRVGDDTLEHAQRGTLPQIAILCFTSRRTAALAVGDGDAIGSMSPDGHVSWFDKAAPDKQQPPAVVVRCFEQPGRFGGPGEPLFVPTGPATTTIRLTLEQYETHVTALKLARATNLHNVQQYSAIRPDLAAEASNQALAEEAELQRLGESLT